MTSVIGGHGRTLPTPSTSAAPNSATSAQARAELAAAEDDAQTAPNPDLLDNPAVDAIYPDELPEDLARRLFEALRLEIHYDHTTNTAHCKITLIAPPSPQRNRPQPTP